MGALEDFERWDEAPTLVTETSDLYPQLIEEDGSGEGGEAAAEAAVGKTAELGQPQPPALPMPLVRVLRRGDAWLDALPSESRVVLEAVRHGHAPTPAARVAEAISGPGAGA